MSSNLAACEIGSTLGFDIAIIDAEHGVHSDRDSDAITCAAKGVGLQVYWRLGGWDRSSVQRGLDAGAQAVIIPQIRTVDEARTAVSHAKYPPLGSRGLGHSRLNTYSAFPDDFLERQNTGTKCILMVETAEALSIVEELAGLPGCDGLFIGPSDLSITCGRGLNRDTEADFMAYRRIARAAKEAGKGWSISAGGRARQKLAIELQAEFFTITDDYSACYAGMQAARRDLIEATSASA